MQARMLCSGLLVVSASAHGVGLQACPPCDFDFAPVDPHAGMDMSGRRRAQMDHSRMAGGGGGGMDGMDVGPAPMAMNRTYFIGAVLQLWDYAPSQKDMKTNMAFSLFATPNSTEPHAEDLTLSADGHLHGGGGGGAHAAHNPSLWTEQSLTRIGTQYYKMAFQEFTDISFTEEVARPAEEQHLGLLGPLIRAEVGDTINVVFKNIGKTMDEDDTPLPFSVHAHGVKLAIWRECCHFADAPSPSLLKNLLKVEGGAAE